jgi:8-oxo-dGTP diphosphatase
MSSSNIRDIAIAVVQHAGCVLVGRRPEGVPLAGFSEFPGGKVRSGETPAEAAARECREETGLEIRIGEVMDETIHGYQHGQLRLHFFAAAPCNPDQQPAAPFCWIALADLKNHQFPPANAAVLAKLQSQSDK